jgi:hypothetical protein
MRDHIRSWRVFCEYFWRSLRAHKKRGNRALSRRSLVECWRMADCARAITAGPPYRLGWVNDLALRNLTQPGSDEREGESEG